MSRALLVVWLSGCLYVGWDDVPTAPVRPEVHASYLANAHLDNTAYWRAEVAAAIAIWNQAALEAGCEPPFEISDDLAAHPVRLVPRAAWPYPVTIAGMYVDEYADDDGVGYVLVRERRPIAPSHLPVLLHELGHALGLTHDEDREAIMYEVTGAVTPHARDIARMQRALGCAH